MALLLPRRPGVGADKPGTRGWAVRWRGSAAVLLGCGMFAISTGWIGAAVGLSGGLAGWWALGRFAAISESGLQHDRELLLELPLALDLLRAGLVAGAGLPNALAAAGGAVRGPLSARLLDVARLLSLHASAETAWGNWLTDTQLAPVARALVRTWDSGAPVASLLGRLADDQREATRARAEAAVRRLGVRAVVPLGMCFLPAFVLVGVVPVVVGLAKTALV
jgi:pilus assembly protein TadC